MTVNPIQEKGQPLNPISSLHKVRLSSAVHLLRVQGRSSNENVHLSPFAQVQRQLEFRQQIESQLTDIQKLRKEWDEGLSTPENWLSEYQRVTGDSTSINLQNLHHDPQIRSHIESRLQTIYENILIAFQEFEESQMSQFRNWEEAKKVTQELCNQIAKNAKQMIQIQERFVSRPLESLYNP